MICYIIQTFLPLSLSPCCIKANLSLYTSVLQLTKTFVVETSYFTQLLSCYVFTRESITPLICSVAVSLYDIIVRYHFHLKSRLRLLHLGNTEASTISFKDCKVQTELEIHT